jgi:hypothetical protein
VTENLTLFWRETYLKLKQQLQRKYPPNTNGGEQFLADCLDWKV